MLALDDGSDEPIDLYICSPGGSLTTTFALCDVIDTIRTPLNKHIYGIAASGGALVAMAGANNPLVHTECGKHTTFLIHDGESGCIDSYTGFQSYAKWNADITDRMYDYIAQNSRLSAKEIKKIRGTEHFFTADKALEYGIVDEVL